MKKRLVLDTSVVVAALRSRRGASNRLLEHVVNKKLSLLVSPPLFLEYEEVLKRPEHRLAHGLTEEQLDDFLSELAALVEPINVHFRWRPVGTDPSDEMVLETAINGRADAIISFNIRDFSAAKDFEIPVLLPGEFLRSWRHE